MYKFAGYGIKINDEMTNVFAKNRDTIMEVTKQQHLKETDIVQLFYFEKQNYTEPKNESNTSPELETLQ